MCMRGGVTAAGLKWPPSSSVSSPSPRVPLRAPSTFHYAQKVIARAKLGVCHCCVGVLSRGVSLLKFRGGCWHAWKHDGGSLPH